MKTAPHSLKRLLGCLQACVLALATLTFAQDAEELPRVEYTPQQAQLEGVMPYAKSSQFAIRSPANHPSGTTVMIRVVPDVIVGTSGAPSIPAGVSPETALKYVSVSPSSFPCSGPDQVTIVTVTVAFPADAVAGQYGYKFLAVDWPEDPNVGLLNIGAFLNGTVTAAQNAPGNPPVVYVESPLDGASYSFAPDAFPAKVPYNFNAAVDGGSPVITEVTAMFGRPGALLPVGFEPTGLNTGTVTANGMLEIPGPGTYVVEATATNSVGDAVDAHTFTVSVTGLPPTVIIDSPTRGTSYTYRAGSVDVLVPYQFTARSRSGVIKQLTATVDGVPVAYSPTALGGAVESRLVYLPYNASGAGRHTLAVTATDDFGLATDESYFDVDYVAPTPTISIGAPTSAQEFVVPVGSSTVDVPYTFVATSNQGFVVDSVTAALGSTAVFPTTVGLGSATAHGSGVLYGLAPGTYTLRATANSAGLVVNDTVTFSVIGRYPPPAVVINTPPVDSVFTLVSYNGVAAPLNVPLTFTGTSNASAYGFVITQLTATLNAAPLLVTSSNLNAAVSDGAASLVVTQPGTYQVSVSAVDGVGTAMATRSFEVRKIEAQPLTGRVFFDANFDGLRNHAEPGVRSISVKLLSSAGAVLATRTTDASGLYSFGAHPAGTYTVVAVIPKGFSATTLNEQTLNVTATSASVPDIGLGLKFSDLTTMSAGGFTIGYWKNNLEKAIAGKKGGTQVSAAKCAALTDLVGTLALSDFAGITMKQASAIMASKSAKPSDLLAKQLIASEYNFANGAYIGGNEALTACFIWWGEFVHLNPSLYSASYTLWAKDWFDAYNNSHGGLVTGPKP